MKNRILSMLALLLTAATGAWAQSETSLTSTDGKVWTLASMPAYNVELEVVYKTDTEVTLTYDGEAVPTDGVKGVLNNESEFIEKLAVAVNEAGTTTAVSGATVTFTSSDATVIAFKSDNSYVATGALADIAFLKEGSATLTISYAGSGDYAKSSAELTVTVAEKIFTIEMASDADDWTVDPTEAKAGTEIKATYKGKLKVKSVKAKKKAAPGYTYDGGTSSKYGVNYDPSKLVDGKKILSNDSKWCTSTDDKVDGIWYCEFHTASAVQVNGYTITTGSDNLTWNNRNPKDWVLKAKANSSDAWTTIATVTNDATLKDENCEPFDFNVNVPGMYQYFRFEVSANQGSSDMQIEELELFESN